MKLNIIICLALFLLVSAGLNAQVITLSETDTPVETVFKKIERQSGYSFVYRDQLLNKYMTVTIKVKEMPLERVLRLCLKDLPLTYAIIDKTIVINSKQKEDPAKMNGPEPTTVIKGKVLDDNGKPLEGVSVTLKGKSKGVVTNGEGEYSLTVNEKNPVLAFTHVGMQTTYMNAGKETTLNAILRPEEKQLEEMVITGYGIRENRENQVGSAVVVTSKDLEHKPVDRVDRLLEGLVPGLQFQQQDLNTSSARPRFETRIRGEGSFRAAGDPMWIIDGVPIFTGDATNQILGMETSISPLTYLNPNDIESITILKDATATTIYGANGANGVIMITTKKGSAAKNLITYNLRTGVGIISNNKFQVLTGDEYRELVKETYANAGQPYPFDPARDVFNTDWYDVFFRNGNTMLHDISFSGGTDKTKYFVSGSYYREKMTMIANQTDRITLRMNLDQQIHKKVALAFKMGGSYNANTLFTPGNDYYKLRPNINPYNPDGTFALFDSVTTPPSRFLNSLARAYQNDDNQSTIAVNGSIGVKADIFKGLSFTSTNGFDFYNMREDRYSSFLNWSGRDLDRNPVGYANRAQNSYLQWISINHLNFNREFGVHGFNAVLGTEASSGKRNSVSASGYGFATDRQREVSAAPDENRRGSSSAEKRTAYSILSRLSYSYDGRYILTANLRRDGNSRFGKDVKWATFRSVGAAWNISNESFWNSELIDFAKAKLSYGTNGNSRIGDYARGIYSYSDSYSYNGRPGAIQTTGPNPVFSWETTYMFNAGIDLSFLSRVSVSVEVYRNITRNLINNVDVTRTTGETTIYQNLGSLQNQGIELNVHSTNIKTRDFQWQTSLNIAHNENEMLELYNGNDKVYAETFHRVGEDINTYYLVRWAGVDPATGLPMWYDRNDNLTFVFDLNNRVAAGHTTPDFFGGMVNTFSYKGFTLSGLINFSVGGVAFSTLRRDAEADGLDIKSGNQSRNLLDRWQKPGDIALTPKLSPISTSSSRNSTRFLHSKTNARLSNLSLSYQLPKTLAQRISMSFLSAYVQADNVVFWTPYEANRNRNTYKNSFSSYPLTTTVSIGLTAGL